MKLIGNLMEDAQTFNAKTDGYGNYHFTDDDIIGEQFKSKYNLQISIGEYNIIDAFEVENNSIVYVVLHKDKAKYKIITETQEEYFDKIIEFFKQPFRYLQFVTQTRGYEERKFHIGCKDKSEQNFAELEKVGKDGETFQRQTKNAKKNKIPYLRINYKSKCVRIKLCPGQEYSVNKTINKEEKTEDFKCTSAIFENTINLYELNFKTSKRNSSCILKNSKQVVNKNSCDDKTSPEEKELYELINLVFDQNNGDANIDYREEKIQKLLRNIFNESGGEKCAASAADEINYKFDLNVIVEKRAQRIFKKFRKNALIFDKKRKKIDNNNESQKNKLRKVLDSLTSESDYFTESSESYGSGSYSPKNYENNSENSSKHIYLTRSKTKRAEASTSNVPVGTDNESTNVKRMVEDDSAKRIEDEALNIGKDWI
uniref:Vitellogenin domain-containing protein n=1 Tax=Meloidogyne hapla TaxID=6305 RepID=A0A1I8BV32_MELHA